MTTRALLVEDDRDLAALVVETLAEAGFETRWIADGDEARTALDEPYDIVILDLMLPGTYGLDLLKKLRAQSDVPVLILTARNETPDKVRALGLGADDYITKPFWPDELLARVRARMRRPVMVRGDELTVGTLRISLGGRRAFVGDEELNLTKVELDILIHLARRKESAVSRRALVESALDPEKQGTERTLDVHVSRLRKKLGPSGPRIDTVWGIGYRLVPGEPAPPERGNGNDPSESDGHEGR